MTKLNALRLSRKADREKLADVLETIGSAHGATCERWEHGRDIHLTFTLNGSRACIGIDGDGGLPIPLISWIAPNGVGQCFGGTFPGAARAPRNGRPHHKATSVPGSMADLVDCLDGGLGTIRLGCAIEFYVHPWAADAAWIGAGRPEPRAEWIERYRATGLPAPRDAWEDQRALREVA